MKTQFTMWDDKVFKNWLSFRFGQNLKRRARGQKDLPQYVPFRARKSGLELWTVTGDKNPNYVCTWEHFDDCVRLASSFLTDLGIDFVGNKNDYDFNNCFSRKIISNANDLKDFLTN